MWTILLSGAGGSTNWLPLIFPLIAIVAAFQLMDYIIRRLRRSKTERENKLINDVTTGMDDSHEHGEG